MYLYHKCKIKGPQSINTTSFPQKYAVIMIDAGCRKGNTMRREETQFTRRVRRCYSLEKAVLTFHITLSLTLFLSAKNHESQEPRQDKISHEALGKIRLQTIVQTWTYYRMLSFRETGTEDKTTTQLNVEKHMSHEVHLGYWLQRTLRTDYTKLKSLTSGYRQLVLQKQLKRRVLLPSGLTVLLCRYMTIST